MSRQHSSRQIGRLGEKHLSILATENGVTCNRSEEDENGWDLLLEWPESASNLPTDMRIAARAALLQVKTSVSGKRHWKIKLSNALKMAKSPLPYFIILVESKSNDKYRYLLLHFWQDLIEETLRAARKADSEQDNNLHNRYISVSFSKDDVSDDPIATIETVIDSFGNSYSSDKSKLINGVGFEDESAVANFTISFENHHEAALWQLGLGDGLAVEKFTLTSKRFGILAGKPHVSATSGRLFVEPIGSQGLLQLRLPTGSPILLAAKWLSGGIIQVPKSAPRSRIDAGILDLLLCNNGQLHAQGRVSYDSPMALSHVMHHARMQALEPGQLVDCAFIKDGARREIGSFKVNDHKPEPYWKVLYQTLEAVSKVCHHFGSPDMDLVFDEIGALTADRQIFSMFVSGGKMRFEFEPAPDTPTKFESFLGYSTMEFAGRWFGVVVESQVTSDRPSRGTRRRINFGPPTILYAVISKEEVGAMTRTAYLSQVEGLARKEAVCAIGNIHKFAKAADGKTDLILDYGP